MIAPDESAASQVEETAAPEIQDLRSLTDAEVSEVLTGWGHKSYRTRQLLDWVYKKRVCTFDEMTDLSQELRAQLPEAFRMQSLECAREQVSSWAKQALEKHVQRMAHLASTVDALNPDKTLQRGFAVARKDGKAVRDAADLALGDQLALRFHKGHADVTVTRVTSDPDE